MTLMRTLILIALTGLAACSPAPAPPANESDPEPVPIASPIPPTPTPSPSPIMLTGLSEAATARLRGELRCAFLDEEGTLLLAGAADVGAESRPNAVVMRDGRPALLAARETGGFDALTRGGGFAGEGLSVSLTRGADRETGHEGSSHAATLSVEAPGFAPRAIDGVWECGP